MRVAYAQLSTLRTFEMEECNCVYCCFSLSLFPFADSIVPLFFFSRHPVQLLCGNDMSFCFNFHFDMIFSCLPLHRTFYFMRYQRQCLRTLWTIFVHQIWDFVKDGIELKRQNECHAFGWFSWLSFAIYWIWERNFRGHIVQPHSGPFFLSFEQCFQAKLLIACRMLNVECVLRNSAWIHLHSNSTLSFIPCSVWLSFRCQSLRMCAYACKCPCIVVASNGTFAAEANTHINAESEGDGESVRVCVCMSKRTLGKFSGCTYIQRLHVCANKSQRHAHLIAEKSKSFSSLAFLVLNQLKKIYNKI